MFIGAWFLSKSDAILRNLKKNWLLMRNQIFFS